MCHAQAFVDKFYRKPATRTLKTNPEDAAQELSSLTNEKVNAMANQDYRV